MFEKLRKIFLELKKKKKTFAVSNKKNFVLHTSSSFFPLFQRFQVFFSTISVIDTCQKFTNELRRYLFLFFNQIIIIVFRFSATLGKKNRQNFKEKTCEFERTMELSRNTEKIEESYIYESVNVKKKTSVHIKYMYCGAIDPKFLKSEQESVINSTVDDSGQKQEQKVKTFGRRRSRRRVNPINATREISGQQKEDSTHETSEQQRQEQKNNSTYENYELQHQQIESLKKENAILRKSNMKLTLKVAKLMTIINKVNNICAGDEPDMEPPTKKVKINEKC
ncbi:hypothetical protein RFI_01422 [Reticulomyxa filosa]|uniref:Uncharacterized protein n=1 Tax=Reticulomyxa filosa TaxID=46433 RepID=X6PC49_RETFI|nr:hypothetical protein RFI_01422 [Reticulomyxa filosa]|eukprot:ETO35639.1 hypothetical protein RFI_01422 [Reticulomyxa filosa]